MYSQDALSDKFFQVPLEASAVDNLVFLTVVAETIFTPGSTGSCWNSFGCLTHGWSLMALKTLLMGALAR